MGTGQIRLLAMGDGSQLILSRVADDFDA